jgi:hypothetical protein
MYICPSCSIKIKNTIEKKQKNKKHCEFSIFFYYVACDLTLVLTFTFSHVMLARKIKAQEANDKTRKHGGNQRDALFP